MAPKWTVEVEYPFHTLKLRYAYYLVKQAASTGCTGKRFELRSTGQPGAAVPT
jgi:hypothetical protein